ncbi:hypothetical protein QZH41_003225 [Actinostola sp. cb2023]|nr:hypothetical protein QZH41_003225 [Actinostola sp. cb2023]
MFALLYLLIHWAMLGVTDIAADKTCTSLPQQWHKPRTQTIEADPIMKCVFAQASKDKDGGRKRKPVHCKLYNAAKKVRLSNNEIMSTCASMSQEQKVPPFSYLLSDQENAQHINTVIGNVPLGGYLDYQLQDEKKKKSVFSVTKDKEALLPDMQLNRVEPFPDIPLVDDGATFDLTTFTDSPATRAVLEKVTVSAAEARKLHNSTVQQALSAEWHRQRRLRLTASNFGRVLARKRLPSDSFMNSLFVSKDLSNVQSVNHGKQNESLARTIYCHKMQKKEHRLFTVYESGLVVNPLHPFLAATPDGKVFDPTERNSFGLIEIKCPYTWRNMTLLEACQDDKFHCHMVDDEIHLKRDHTNGYYAQVQGQLALSGLNWCDFVVYLTGSRNMNVQRVYFDSHYWRETLFPKMRDFYVQHCLKYFADQMCV